MAVRVRSVGIAWEGTLTIGVRVPCKSARLCFAKATHIVVEEHEPLLGLGVAVGQSRHVERGSLVGSVFTTNVLEQLLDNGSSPGVTGVADNRLVKLGVAHVLLLVGHGQTLVDGVSDTKQVVRVDLESLRKARGGTHELRENQRRLVGLVLAENKLHRGGVHAVTETGDQGKVGNREQGKVLVALNSLVATVSSVDEGYLLVVHWSEVKRTVGAVDVADKLGNEALKLGGLGESWGSDLNEDDLATPLGVGEEELFKGLQLRRQ
jgi:hypothetical protein